MLFVDENLVQLGDGLPFKIGMVKQFFKKNGNSRYTLIEDEAIKGLNHIFKDESIILEKRIYKTSNGFILEYKTFVR